MKRLFTFALLLACLLPCAAADKAIHQLNAGGTAQNGDRFPIDRFSGTWANFYLTVADLKSQLNVQTTINYETNYYVWSTNYVDQSTYVSNYFFTNVFLDTYMSNFYQTNYYTTNNTWTYEITTNTYWTYTTNLVYNYSYPSNFFQTNIFVTDNTVSNFFLTNITYWTTNFTQVTTNVFFYTTNLITTNLYATYINTTNLYTSNIFTTNITAKNLYVENIYVTNQVFYATNSWPGPTNQLDISGFYDQNFAATSDCSILGITNKPSTTTAEVLLSIYNTAATNITVTQPVQFKDGDYVSSHVVTNGTTGYFWLRYTPVGPRTNCVFRQM